MVNEEVTMMLSVVPGSLTGISALMGGLSSITNVFTDITRQIDANVGLIDTSIITASTIVAQFGLNAANAFGEFEQGMKVAQMVSGQTNQEMDYLRAKANELSVSFRADIDQITEGLQTLGRAGLNSASEQTEVLEAGLSTAKLEGRDLNGVLEELIQNTALLGGNLKSNDFGEASGYLNDVMVATSMTAPITTHDVSETLKYSGGIAAAAGADVNTEEGRAILEDYMGAIAAFAQKGVTGSIAGTALRAFFNKPATQDSSVTDALASIHLKPEYLWEDDEQTMKPVSEQIEIIENQMEELNVSTMDQLQIWSKIVGGKMGQQMMKLHSDDIKSLTKDIQASNDAQSLASGTFDTYQMKMKEMTEQGQVAFRQFGQYAATVLTPVLEILKNILAFFSNPVVAGGAFVSALALIMSAISKIKNLFTTLKQEFAEIMHYLKTGEPLMAVRPSTVRKSNRFGDKSRFQSDYLSKKYPGQSELVAYEREKMAAYDEELIVKYGRDNASIYKAANKLRSQVFNQAGFSDITGIQKMKGFIKADNKRDLDSFITKFLIEKGLWKPEFTETYNRFGGDLTKTLRYHVDDIEEILRNQYKNVTPPKKNTYNRSKDPDKDNYSLLPKETLTSLDPNDPELDRKRREMMYESVIDSDSKRKQQEKDAIDRFTYYDIDKRKPFDYSGLKEQQSGIDEFFMGQDKKFRTRQKEILKENAIESFVRSLEESPDETLAATPLYRQIHNKEDLQTFMRYLKYNGLLSGNDAIDSEISKTISRMVFDEDRPKQADEFVSSFMADNKKNVKGLSSISYGLMSREDFMKHIGRIPEKYSFLSYDDIQKAFLRANTITDPASMIRQLSMAKEYKDFKPASPEDIFRLFGLEGKDAVRVWNSYERAGIAGFNPFSKATEAENEREEAKIRTKREKSLRKHLSEKAIENMGGYWDETTLGLTQKQFNKMFPAEKDNYLSVSQMKKKIKEIYGLDVSLPSKKTDAAKIAYPYFADWMKLSDAEMAAFAPKLGVTDTSGSRSNVIGRLREQLTKSSVSDIIKQEEYEKKYGDNLEETIKLLAHKSQLLDKIILQMKELSGMPLENARIEQEAENVYQRLVNQNYINPNHYSKEELNEKFGIDIDNFGGGQYGYLIDYYKQDDKRIEDERLLKDNVKPFFKNPEKKPDKKSVKSTLLSYEDYFEEDNRRREEELRIDNPDSFGFDNSYIDYYKKSKKEEQEKINEIYEEINFVPEKTKMSQIKDKASSFYSSAIKDPLSTAYDNFKKQLKADRSDRLLNFGKGSKMNGLLNAIDMIGGPFMVATGAATLAIDAWKGAFESFCQELKKAESSVKEAYSERDSAESSIRRNLKEQNEDITDEELDEQLYGTYTDLYKNLTENQEKYRELASHGASTMDELEYDEEKDDGSYKKKEEEIDEETKNAEELKKNTAALYAATSQLNFSLNTLQSKMTDTWWGLDGWTGAITNALGKYQDTFKNWGEGSSFLEEGGKFLLTAQQKDENYSGYTEMAGLMLEDFKDSGGDWRKGLTTMMGKDADFTSSIMSEDAQTWMDSMAKLSSGQMGGLSSGQNARLQASMKYDQKSWNKLAKDIAKFESKNKKTYGSTDKRTTKKIEGQIDKLRSTLGEGFDRTRVLQAAYLEIAQGMFSVAQTVFVPLVQQNAVSAAQAVSGIGGVHQTVDGTGSSTYNTAAIASSIAAMLGTIALAQAGDAAKTQASLGVDLDNSGTAGDTQEERNLQDLALNTNSGTEFMNEALKKSQGNAFLMNAGNWLEQTSGNVVIGEYLKSRGKLLGGDRSAADFLAKVYGVSTYMSVYGMDSEAATKKYEEWYNTVGKNAKPEDILKTLGKNWQFKGFVDQIEQAYLNSGEEGEGNGGGAGSGSGDKDKDTGTKKERVDLVLCSKKEIPKLNVNLFKKPPTFTVLNKNFKVRDVKINTEDTPKAIMSAIKNSFIDVQKRSDPKIIQDEDAVYDPDGSTEGNPLPSGTAKTRTD